VRPTGHGRQKTGKNQQIMMKVLIADDFEPVGRDLLARQGFAVVFEPGLTADSLPGALANHDPHVLIVRSTRVTGAAIAAAQRLALVVRAGAGYDTIDVAAASRDGISVANCPGKNAIAVAELTWALILSCDRRVPDQTADLRAGSWNKKQYSQARGLYGATLGVIGLGTIASEVITRARAFGMHLIAWSRSLTRERAGALGVQRAASPAEVAATADVVTVHVAATAATEGLIGESFLSAMKPGAYLINTSRGSVVDEQALRRAIASKGIRAGLDVYRDEPSAGTGRFSTDLAALAGVYGTHHVGASTEQAQNAIAVEAARIIAHFRNSGGQVLHCVNRATHSSATCTLTVRHRNRPGVLAKVFDVLSEGGINVEEMDNVLYDGAQAACAHIRLAQAPNDQQMKAIRAGCSDILGLDLTPLANPPG
jgi:D-3-phosphoglycerate dehydrogenase / 2-oxoglutarate reductase